MDLRYAWRGIVRNPGFAILVIATMALGIGGNTVMFSVFRAVFLRPLPFPGQDRLVTIWESDPARGVRERRLSPANFVDWRAQTSSFESLGVLPNWTGAPWPFNVIGHDGYERVYGIYASSGLFRTLGVAPMIGRTLSEEDDSRMGIRNVVLGHSYWKERFGADPGVLGKSLEVDTFRGGKFNIVGVMPENFEFPPGVKFWLSLGSWGAGPMPALDTENRCCAWYFTMARLKLGVTMEQAATELTVLAQGATARHATAEHVQAVRVVPLRETLVGTQRLALSALFAAVGCVLLIGCANVANLLLSRGVGRRQEVLTRFALGATRWRVARQLLVESTLLCGFGAAAGLALTAWTVGPLARILKEYVPLTEGTRVDAMVLGFAAALAITTGAICGLAPLVDWRSVDWANRSRTEGAASRKARYALVVGEVALAVMLIASAGLLVRTAENLSRVDVGFRTDRILTLTTDLTTGPLRERGRPTRFLQNLIPQLAALPRVRTAAATTGLPFECGLASQPVTREGKPLLSSADSPHIIYAAVTPGYFSAMGIALKKGRLFTEGDTLTGKLVAILNETAARRYWPGEDPVGTRFTLGSRERIGHVRPPSGPFEIDWDEVVGVVADVHSSGFGVDVQPQVYFPYTQFPIYDPTIVLRTAGDPAALAPAVRAVIKATNPGALVTRVRTMDEVAAASISGQRLRARLAGAFSAFALLLGMLGIYGVMSYTVAQRSQEIGIRMALGAQARQVAGLVVGNAMRMTVGGIVLGLLASIAVARWISSLLFGVNLPIPLTLAPRACC
jgi:putative ABC transport system permease protein